MPIAVRVAQIVNDKAMMGSSFSERVVYFIGLGIGRLIYRVRALGTENLPAGGFLLLPNHISFVDAIVLQLACPRRIRFIVDQEYYRNRILHPILRIAGCIPITPRRAKDAMRAAADQIRAGEVVCLFPEGQLSRSGTLLRLRRGYELIAREARRAGRPGVVGSLVGLDLFLSRRPLFLEMAKAISLRRAGRFWPATSA